jgi:hypothetical protein
MKYLSNDMIKQAMDETHTNLTWDDSGIWKGWTYSLDKNRYYFDDIGDESLTTLWSSEFLNKAY